MSLMSASALERLAVLGDGHTLKRQDACQPNQAVTLVSF
jgi:hypothetical protein